MQAIITTTIHKPTEAIYRFCEIAESHAWKFYIVGDKKTPHKEYDRLEVEFYNVRYLSPSYQEKYKKLSDLIGWNCIQRRNIGFVEAYNDGAKIFATVDDDNIPNDDWGQDLYLEEKVCAMQYDCVPPVFDPLSTTEYPHLWHRGYPIQLLKDRYEFSYKKCIEKKFLIQADLWDGEPDVDAICRLMYQPKVKFNRIEPFCSNKLSPFNSQNTFLSRKVMKDYFLFPHIGRMDDIWASYYVQSKFPNSVVYGKSSVFQKRNEHNIMEDMRNEMIGYEKTLDFIKHPFKTLPKRSLEAFKEYRRILL